MVRQRAGILTIRMPNNPGIASIKNIDKKRLDKTMEYAIVLAETRSKLLNVTSTMSYFGGDKKSAGCSYRF